MIHSLLLLEIEPREDERTRAHVVNRQHAVFLLRSLLFRQLHSHIVFRHAYVYCQRYPLKKLTRYVPDLGRSYRFGSI